MYIFLFVHSKWYVNLINVFSYETLQRNCDKNCAILLDVSLIFLHYIKNKIDVSCTSHELWKFTNMKSIA